MTEDDKNRGPRGFRGEQGIPGVPQEGWWLVRELERLGRAMEELKVRNRVEHAKVVDELSAVKQEIGALKVKASFYGALSGLGAGIAIFLAQLFGHGFGPR